MSDDLEKHYGLAARKLARGQVVVLLGAGVNRCPADGDARHPPDGAQLAARLAEAAEFPDSAHADLLRVSQYYSLVLGSGSLYEELRDVFNADFTPTPIHAFLAEASIELRRRGEQQRLLMVTTNYDDCLESAFRAAGEAFDVVAYIADGDHAGKFMHHPHGEEPVLIEVANGYQADSLVERPVILKLHGAVDRMDPDRDSYVITEDDYIHYLTRADPSTLVPVQLAARLGRSHLLFLGYSLRDWNVRVILHHIWIRQHRRYKHWAVQLRPEEIDRAFWEARGVDIYDVPLTDYVAELARRFFGLEDGDEP